MAWYAAKSDMIVARGCWLGVDNGRIESVRVKRVAKEEPGAEKC